MYHRHLFGKVAIELGRFFLVSYGHPYDLDGRKPSVHDLPPEEPSHPVRIQKGRFGVSGGADILHRLRKKQKGKEGESG